MLLPNRNGSTDSYRYGFNGKEKDDEVKGEGNSYDYGARMYNPRVGRWYTTDKFKKANLSAYQYTSNNPIVRIDPDGNDEIVFFFTLARKDDALVIMVNYKILENDKDDLVFRVIGPKDGRIEDINSVVKSIEGSDLYVIEPAIPNTNIANTRKGWEARKRKLPFAEPNKMTGVTIDDYTYLGVLLNNSKPLPEKYKKSSRWGAFLRGAENIEVSLDVAGYAGFAEGAAGLGLYGTKVLVRKGLTEVLQTAGDNAINLMTRAFQNSSKVEALAASKGIKSMQNGLRTEKTVMEILGKMFSKEGFDTTKYSIGGYYNSGKYFINEGNHRMAAALEYLARTGSSKYVDELLETGNWSKKAPISKTYDFTVNLD